MELYRYISFDKFKDVIENKVLMFANPLIEWKKLDKNEAYLYKAIKDNKNLEKLKEGHIKKAIINQLKQGGMYENQGIDWFGMRCQSWCQEEDSLKMWNCYSEKRCAVSIAVDLSDLTNLKYADKGVEGFFVEYVEEFSIEDMLNKVVGKTGEFYYPNVLKWKQDKFSFEKEYRIYLSLLDSEGVYCGEENHRGIEVNIDKEITHFIKRVYCHPESPEEYRRQVKEYCREKNLVFVDNC